MAPQRWAAAEANGVEVGGAVHRGLNQLTERLGSPGYEQRLAPETLALAALAGLPRSPNEDLLIDRELGQATVPVP